MSLAHVAHPSQETLHERLRPVNQKRFKACRLCRKHKLRCERDQGYSDGRCRRCVDSGLACTFDVIESRKRKAQYDDLYHNDETVTTNHGQRTTVSHDRNGPSGPVSNVGAHCAPVPSPEVPAVSLSASRAEETTSASRAYSHRGAGFVSASCSPWLTSTDLRAPVTAIHNMSPDTNPSATLPQLSATRPSYMGPADHWQSGSLFKQDASGVDVISKGVLTQSRARHLFHQFMSSASIFLPIFDTAIDSFDALRKREPLCFSAILALACRLEGQATDLDRAQAQMCLVEVKALVAESLFSSTPSLGNIQAIVLLAAYAESTWFAIGHGLRMAADLGLDKAIVELSHHSDHDSSSMGRRQLMRNTRVWLALCFMDREIAMGLARPHRTEHIQRSDLQIFGSLPQAVPSDLRLASLVEAVDTRATFHAKLIAHESLESSGYAELLTASDQFRQWYTRWDALHQDRGYDESSFQRVSLQGQMHYAIIFLGCACLGRLSADEPLAATLRITSGVPSQILELVMSTAIKQLRLVLTAESYKWHLKWATNYTVLSLTFTVVLLLEVLRYRTDLVDTEEALTIARSIGHLFEKYHDHFFSRLIHARLTKHIQLAPNTLSGPARSSVEQRAPSIQPHSNDIEQNGAGFTHDSNGLHSTQASNDSRETNVGLGEMNFDFPVNDLLDTSEWMINPTFMLGHELPEWDNGSVSLG